MDIFLHADDHQSFYKLALLFFMEVTRNVQASQNRKLVIFSQYMPFCSIVVQNIQIFHGCPVMSIVTCCYIHVWCWVVVVKNGHRLLDLSTLKSTIYIYIYIYIYIPRMNCWKEATFLHADTNLGKLSVNLIIGCSKMGKIF